VKWAQNSVYRDEHGYHYLPPGIPVAGDGRTLVYYAECPFRYGDCKVVGNAIRRISGRRDFKVTASVYPSGLAAVDGLIAVAEPTTPRLSRASPAWSPDGTRIAFIRRQQDLSDRSTWVSTENGSGIYVVRADGGGEARLVSEPVKFGNESMDWSPQGRFLFNRWSSDDPNTPRVYVANADGSGQRHVADGFSPVWSPDGAKLAFARRDGTYIADAEGTASTRISPDWSGAGAWSPDGMRLALARPFGITPPGGIYLVNADGTGEAPLPAVPQGATAEVRRVDALDWSPDGSRIAYEAELEDDSSAIFVASLDGGGARRVSAGFSSRSPVWSPDGSRIAFARDDGDVDYRSGRSRGYGPVSIYVMNADGSGVRRVTTPPRRTSRVSVRRAVSGKLLTRFPVSGDVEALALSRSRVAVLVHPTRGHRIEIRGARNGRLAKAVSVPRSTGGMSIAGRTLVFSVGRTIHLLDAATGRMSPIAKAASTPIGLSIEGKRVAWAENLRSGRARIRAVILAPGGSRSP
jgi:Tol biopolymer transport system component